METENKEETKKKKDNNEALRKALEKVNFPKYACLHLIGEKHSKGHRMGVGVIVMITGVVIAKSLAGVTVLQINIVGDVIGYMIHAIGAIPFIDHIVESSSKQHV